MACGNTCREVCGRLTTALGVFKALCRLGLWDAGGGRR
jgi:hypothetical protein